MTDPTALYDTAEAAALLRATPGWLKYNVNRRGFPSTVIGGVRYFTPEHIAEIKHLCEVRTNSARPNRRRSA